MRQIMEREYGRVSFPNFVNMTLRRAGTVCRTVSSCSLNIHWLPLTSRCGYCSLQYSAIARLGTDYQPPPGLTLYLQRLWPRTWTTSECWQVWSSRILTPTPLTGTHQQRHSAISPRSLSLLRDILIDVWTISGPSKRRWRIIQTLQDWFWLISIFGWLVFKCF